MNPVTERVNRVIEEVETQLNEAPGNPSSLMRSMDEEEIKKGYRIQAMKHHPDKHANAAEKDKQHHEKMFKEVSEAYSILRDQKQRESHIFLFTIQHILPKDTSEVLSGYMEQKKTFTFFAWMIHT